MAEVPLSAAVPRPPSASLAYLLLAAWITLPTLNRIDVTWHFFLGGGANLAALLLLGAWGASARPSLRRAATAFAATSLFLSFFLMGVAMRLPPQAPAAADSYFDDEAEGASRGYL